MPTLFDYSKKCETIVECGVRTVVSSYAFASGLLQNNSSTKKLFMIDPFKSNNVDPFLELCSQNNIDAEFLNESNLLCKLFPTDMLFIDTWHVYGQLKRELDRWNSYVTKYIIMHDTTIDEVLGETIRCKWDAKRQSAQFNIPIHEINKGLQPAIDEFLNLHIDWRLEKRFTNNNGLTILSRVNDSSL